MARPRGRLAAVLLAAPLLACSGDGGPEGPGGDLGDYCGRMSAAFCPAYLDCDPFNFPRAFRSLEECVSQTEGDCLDPPAGQERCDGATVEETDLCVAYLEENHPDGCERLFGPSADMSPCDAICD